MTYNRHFAAFALVAGLGLTGASTLLAGERDWDRRDDRFARQDLRSDYRDLRQDSREMDRIRADIARDRAQLNEFIRCGNDRAAAAAAADWLATSALDALERDMRADRFDARYDRHEIRRYDRFGDHRW